VARSHHLLEGVRPPAACLIVGTDVRDKVEPKSLYFGLISSRSAVTTLESRIKVRRCVRIKPDSEAGLRRLVSERPHAKNLADELRHAHISGVLIACAGSRATVTLRLDPVAARCWTS
jgi:hypothetical protein